MTAADFVTMYLVAAAEHAVAAMAQQWRACVDARVLAALHDVPDSEPMEALAEAAGVTIGALRMSMRQLALRHTEHLEPAGDA